MKNRWIGPMGSMVTTAVVARSGSQRMVAMLAQHTPEDLNVLRQLLEAATIRPVVERTYPLDQVPEALRYVGAGHAQAKLVITV